MASFRLFQTAQELIPSIRNIFCVGRNYRDHASELGNDVPRTPMIFGKFTHALAAAKNTVYIPNRDEIHHELEIVLYIDKPVTLHTQARDVVGAVALGLDLTDRKGQTVLKQKGHPWEFAKSFTGSAIVTDFYAFDAFDNVLQSTFELERNGAIVQSGHPKDMVFDFDKLVQYTHEHYGLTAGDILFTGTPAGVGRLSAGDHLKIRFGDACWGDFHIETAQTGKGV